MMLTAAVVAIFYLATTNGHIPVVEGLSDKTEHILAFYVLGLLVDFSWPMTGFRTPKALSLFGYGLAIEIVQYFLPHRTFSLFDLGADGIGLLLYALSVPLIKNIYPLSERFKESKTSGEQKLGRTT
jgi:VanZ family protein